MYISLFPAPFLVHPQPTSPKPNLPSSSAYEPPPPPSTRDLGPPPPGFARYADLDKAPGLAPGPSAQPQMPQRRDPNEVTCFKVCLLTPTFLFLLSSYFPHTSVVRRDIMPTIAVTEMFLAIVVEQKEFADMEVTTEKRGKAPRIFWSFCGLVQANIIC